MEILVLLDSEILILKELLILTLQRLNGKTSFDPVPNE